MKRTYLFLLAALLLCACVPTPEQEIIVSKADNVMNARIETVQKEPTPYAVPERVAEAFEGARFSVVIDAAPEVPAGPCPVAEIVPRDFDADWARAMLRGMADGRALMPRETEGGAGMTREGIVREIQAVQNALAEMDENPPKDAEQVRAALMEELAGWEAYYREAPESTDGLAADLSDAQYERTGRMCAEIDELRSGRTHHTALEANRCGRVTFEGVEERLLLTGPRFGREPVAGPLKGVGMTESEAIETAKAFLARLGETGLEPVRIEALNCPLRDNPEDVEQAYKLYFTRPVEGVPTAYTWTLEDVYGVYSQNEGERAYAEPCDQEYAELIVRDTGVQSFEWNSPSTLLRTVNADVELVPFSTILETFRAHVVRTAYPEIEEQRRDGVSATVKVERIALEMSRVRKQNAPGVFLMIPTWTFYGAIVLHGDLGAPLAVWGYTADANGDAVYSVPGGALLQINAIDGTVIDQARGY